MGLPAGLSGEAAPAALAAYARARDWIDRELVRLVPRRRDLPAKARAARAFAAALGDPQRAFPAVQVAGTSGKGSVTALLAHALRAAGLRVGRHVSPYLQAFTEKTWVDGRYLDGLELLEHADALRAQVEPLARDPDYPASVHGLAALGVTWLAFQRAGLDLAVVETGCGGRYDLVQGLDLSLAVITDLGLDHLETLGPTLERIAWHKAGIMAAGRPCLAVRGDGAEVLAAEAERVGAPLTWVEPERVVRARVAGPRGLELVLALPALGEVALELPGAGAYQARNAAVAGAALDLLAREGWPVRAEHLRAGFREPLLPGRFEVVQARPRVILDGAHNGQKLAALAGALGAPGAVAPGPLVVVAGGTGDRDPAQVARALAPCAARLVATAPGGLHGKDVLPPAAVADAARAAGLQAEAVEDPLAAVELALEQAGPEGTVVVTGSLYLVGEVRGRWVPRERVVLQRTSWPAGLSGAG